jgi:hypothetical protein
VIFFYEEYRWLFGEFLFLIMEQDKKIRESFYKRDKDFNETIRAEM